MWLADLKNKLFKIIIIIILVIKYIIILEKLKNT